MTGLLRLAFVGLVRAPLRTAVRIVSLAGAVALIGAMILFVGHSLRTMTASATRSVPLDWQGPVGSHSAAVRIAAAVQRQTGVQQASPVATAPFASIVHRAPVGTIRSGSGAVLAVPPGYLDHIHTFRFLRGSLRRGEIVFDQQLAATLRVEPGDMVSLTPRTGARAHRFRVGGVALVTAPDVLFQPLNPLLGPAPAQPPADIAILPLATFARMLAPGLPTIASAGGNALAVPGAPRGTQWQVQAQVDPHALAGSPTNALRRADRIRNAVERSLPGQVVFVDNLSDTLNSAAGDALYAETLYIMLAVPGGLVALALAYLAALGTAERDRRDLALLRARGASRRSLLFLAAVESAALGLLAGAIGTGGALLAVRLVGSGGAIGTARGLVAFAVCVVLGFAGAVAARIAAGIGVFRESVIQGRRSVRRQDRPLWQRLYLDLLCLAGSGLVYWLTVRTGFSAVINPDSNPTLSLSVYMFFAPALLWLGSALLLVRLRGRFLAWLAGRAGGGRASTWRGFLLASAGRRGAAINRGLLVAGLLLAFGVNLGLFAATYDQQARVDAQLTLGADVVATAPPGAIRRHALEQRVALLSGVAGTTALDRSYAYVGPDLQDIFGIDARTLTRGTSLRDSYFLGGSAAQILARLRSTPDGVLVSRETISDYSLRLGDLLKLRTLDRANGRFKVVPFHVVGVVQEFPAAPRDSFMVANLGYLERATHDPGPNVLFVKANGDPVAASRQVAAQTRAQGTLVKNIRRQTAQTVSSITTVDLGGISRIEETFALVLAAAAMALFVAVALAERRQEFATMAALGAGLREIAAFLWTETVLVLGAALALAALLGWLLAEMLVAMLQHVFDPPPDHLAAPWFFLGGLAAAAVAGGAIAALVAAAGIRRMPLGAILREE
ncbi:MAG: ABC transporter permease [Actinobacteria bacterium]|nr:MAG: ABC transporter permease [Actinomycetota bacterium]